MCSEWGFEGIDIEEYISETLWNGYTRRTLVLEAVGEDYSRVAYELREKRLHREVPVPLKNLSLPQLVGVEWRASLGQFARPWAADGGRSWAT